MGKFDANKLRPVPTAPTRLALRDKLRSKSQSPKARLVTITFEDGDTMEVECFKVSSGVRWKLQSEGFRDHVMEDGKTVSILVPDEFYPRLIQQSYRDPVSKEPIWLETELDDIRAMTGDVSGQFTGPALEMNGWVADAEEQAQAEQDLRGNSGEGATDGSSGMSQTGPT
jgi:hypothetical protein